MKAQCFRSALISSDLDIVERPLMPISLAFSTRSFLLQSSQEPLLPPLRATLLRELPAAAFAIRLRAGDKSAEILL